jgi:hypothetical protein
MKLNDLLLLSGNDIPFIGAEISLHQPTLKEIAFIGEDNFHIGCHFLTFNKNNLSDEDKRNLEGQSDFNIFMSVINSKEKARHKTDALMVLALLFPQCKFKITKTEILLQLENFSSSINEQNYDEFKDILNQIFCLTAEEGNSQYNPADALAARIAEKLKQRKEKLEGERDKKIAIYSQFISILAVGLKKDMNDLLNYTVYQLRDEFKRFQLKQDFDIYVRAKLAGAQDLEEVSNWMEDIHP